MNKLHTVFSATRSFAMAALLTALCGVIAVDKALAGELFEPKNSHLTQSSVAPASRLFVVVDDETAVVANDRFDGGAGAAPTLFGVSERRAIAQWLMRAQRRAAGSGPLRAATPVGRTQQPEPVSVMGPWAHRISAGSL